MTAHNLLGTPAFIGFGLAVARVMPTRLLYRLSSDVSRHMARNRTSLFEILLENYRQIMPSDTRTECLAQMAQKALYHAGCTYIDMLRQAPRDVQRGRIPISVDPDEWARANEILADNRGTVLVGPHMSNFDLAAQWIAAQGFEIQGLSLPNPDAGGRILNRLRAKRGIQMTPISLTSLRAGVKRLNRGGICMTGVDRPTSDRDPLTPFFGRSAHMPTGHVKLALRSKARIQVACCLQREEGAYEIRFPDALEMSRTDDWDRDVRDNVASVLRVVERMILLRPSQWLMFVPVWRDDVCSDLETTE